MGDDRGNELDLERIRKELAGHEYYGMANDTIKALLSRLDTLEAERDYFQSRLGDFSAVAQEDFGRAVAAEAQVEALTEALLACERAAKDEALTPVGARAQVVAYVRGALSRVSRSEPAPPREECYICHQPLNESGEWYCSAAHAAPPNEPEGANSADYAVIREVAEQVVRNGRTKFVGTGPWLAAKALLLLERLDAAAHVNTELWHDLVDAVDAACPNDKPGRAICTCPGWMDYHHPDCPCAKRTYAAPPVPEEPCPECHGRGEVWAGAPWARWFPCGRCAPPIPEEQGASKS